jgi:hypothetical protein
VQSQPVQLYRCTGVAEAACLGVKGAEVMQLWGGHTRINILVYVDTFIEVPIAIIQICSM